MLNCDHIADAKIFNEFAEVVHGLLTVVITLEALSELDVICHGADQLAGCMISDADHIQCVVLQLVLDQFVMLSVVFKSSVDALEIVRLDRVGQCNRNPQLDSFLRPIEIRIEPVVQFVVRSHPQTPEDNIISANIEEEYNQKECRKDPFHAKDIFPILQKKIEEFKCAGRPRAAILSSGYRSGDFLFL